MEEVTRLTEKELHVAGSQGSEVMPWMSSSVDCLGSLNIGEENVGAKPGGF